MIELPHKLKRRPYQLPVYEAREQGISIFDLCWHRRSGKDLNAISFTQIELVQEVGLYWHMLPKYTQARKAIWHGMDNEGIPYIDRFHPDLIAKKNEQEMKIHFKNGSIWQLVGADNVDSLVGSNPKGIVFSEWPLMNPRTYQFLRPILAVNKGWAMFIYTPRGKNHAYRFHQQAQNDPEMFSQTLTIDDTGILTRADIEREKRLDPDLTEDLVQQEFYCNFEASIPGAYYSDQVKLAREQKRIGKVDYDPDLLVHTAWDLGYDDATAIIFFQLLGREIRIIDYAEHNGESILFYSSLLEQKKYRYGTHYLPHDAAAKELGSGKSIEEQLQEAGVNGTEIVTMVPVDHGIQSVRRLFNRFYFDAERCEHLIDCLTQYHKELDEDRSTPGHPFYRSKPEHDWASHGADALRYLAVGFSEEYLSDDDGTPTNDFSGGALG